MRIFIFVLWNLAIRNCLTGKHENEKKVKKKKKVIIWLLYEYNGQNFKMFAV